MPPPSRLPLELLLVIAHHITDDHGKQRSADFNAFLQVNHALYSCLNPILWRSAMEDSATSARVLTHLIRSNHLARLQYFLELGVDIETLLPGFKTSDRELEQPSSLVVAAYLNNLPLAHLLLEKGAKVQHYLSRYSAIHAAHSAEMVQLLLDHHADPERQDHYNRRPLHLYACRDDIAAMRALLQSGVAVNSLGRSFRTPLHDARSTHAVNLLLEFGADVKKRDFVGNTPLHSVVLGGSADAVRLLAEQWPDGVMARNIGYADTPLHVAASAGKLDSIRVMVEHCPEALSTKNKNGDTPYDSGAAQGRIEALILLASFGGGPKRLFDWRVWGEGGDDEVV